MAPITVLRPDFEGAGVTQSARAPRGPVAAGAALTLIDNGKPNAKRLLTLVAAAVEKRLGPLQVDVFSKRGAANPITPDDARALAARSRLVISGLGD